MRIVDEELKLAREFAEDAKLLQEEGRLRSAVNRAYYSLFHAAQAVLNHLGVETKTHGGTITKFGEHVIKKMPHG